MHRQLELMHYRTLCAKQASRVEGVTSAMFAYFKSSGFDPQSTEPVASVLAAIWVEDHMSPRPGQEWSCHRLAEH